MLKTVSPVFLLGTQRSGTTLLTRILSSHSSFYMQNELPMDGLFSAPHSKQAFLERMTAKIERLHGKSLAIDSCDNNWGLKDPLLTNHLPLLAEYFPDSKYILIIRDGRGVVNSYMENRWGLGTNVYTGTLRWQEEVNLQMAFVERFNANSMTIRYEDLIANLSTILPEICHFMGIKFEENMLSYYKGDAGFGLNKENRHTNKAPDTRLAEKWKSKLSVRQIGIIDGVAKNELALNGYALEQQAVYPSILEKWYYLIHQKVVGEIQLQYQLKAKDWLRKYKLIR
jgi:hypothetical protein